MHLVNFAAFILLCCVCGYLYTWHLFGSCVCILLCNVIMKNQLAILVGRNENICSVSLNCLISGL